MLYDFRLTLRATVSYSHKYIMKHRTPPKPKSYNTASKGTCRWCGKPILKKDGSVNTRAAWHPKCVQEYKMIFINISKEIINGQSIFTRI